jgi:prophage regulatory protein
METTVAITGGFIRMRALTQRIPVAKSTIWDWVQKGTFPRPVKLSDSVTAWTLSDVERWEASKLQDSQQAA